MVVELAAIRVLAPWFGTSSTVWTNVIGVVLLALALGYLVGSKLAQRPSPLGKLGTALLIAGLLASLLPFVAEPVARFFLPEGVTLDRAADLLVWGSLATSFVLFAPPAIALGCVGPLAMECLQQRGAEHAGTAGGRVLFASTIGSLLGTFGTTHFLIPELGLRVTLQLAAGILVGMGFCAALMNRKAGGSALLLGLVCVGTIFLDEVRPAGSEDGPRMLATAESTYQSLRVVEFGEGAARTRQLQVNEGFDSYQSVWQPEIGLLPQGYYNYFCPPIWWTKDAGQEPWELLVLGLGAGTTVRVLEGVLPAGQELKSTGIEIDATAVELARRWMDLAPESEGRRVFSGWDARAGMRQLEDPFDQIVLDTYANQMEIPAHLCSVEFFAEVKQKLRPGGWLTVNIGGFGFEDPVISALAQSAAEGFGSPALVLRVPFTRNYVAYLRRDAALPAVGGPEWKVESPEIQNLLAPVMLPESWAIIEPGVEEVLTDDRSDMERRQRESIERRAALLRAQELTL